jgi:uncharacterized protein YndB with AHSA1/START domain
MSAKNSSPSMLTMPSDREIIMTRVFDAPRELVFKAYTNPNLIPQWWGLRSHTTIVDKMEVRSGGIWRFAQRDAKGNEDGFNGEYHEVVPPARLVNTFEWEGMPGHIIVDTATFEELPGSKTRLTITSLFSSVEDRDGMLASGMEGGANETWDRLAELLAKV